MDGADSSWQSPRQIIANPATDKLHNSSKTVSMPNDEPANMRRIWCQKNHVTVYDSDQ